MIQRTPTVAVRPVTADDCRLLWAWVNDQGVRAASFRAQSIPWEEHVAWFRAKHADPQRAMFLVLDDAQRPIGQVRFEPQDETGSAEIIVSIAAARRGQGWGTQAVCAACDAYRLRGLAKQVAAYIKPENTASIRIFEKAGFTMRGETTFRGHAAVCLTLDVSRYALREAS